MKLYCRRANPGPARGENNISKSLVAYFSASGSTRKVAQRLAKAAGADLFEIVPEQPYTAADLDWTDRNSRSTRERDPKCRPAVALTCENMADYDTVYVGFPIWWYVAPTIINTFLEAHDLTGKRVVPFATSGGSRMGGTVAALEPSAPGATFVAGDVLNDASDAKLEAFVKANA